MSCGKVIGNKWEEFQEREEDGGEAIEFIENHVKDIIEKLEDKIEDK